jgi:ribosomal protein L44E
MYKFTCWKCGQYNEYTLGELWRGTVRYYPLGTLDKLFDFLEGKRKEFIEGKKKKIKKSTIVIRCKYCNESNTLESEYTEYE